MDNKDSMAEIMRTPQGGAAALKDAVDNVDVGTKKKAVERAKDPEPQPTAKVEDAPNKYNTPRNENEPMEDYMRRLTVLRAAHDHMHPVEREP